MPWWTIPTSMPASKTIDGHQTKLISKTDKNSMKTAIRLTLLALFTTASLLTGAAQNKQGFSPEKFDADLAAFVTQKAQLTPQEAAKLIPLMKEMHNKQRALMAKIWQTSRKCLKQSDDAEACRKALVERDKLNVELKTIEQKYHNKMMRVVPACKVLAAVEAEDHFFRHAMKQWKNRPPRKKK